MGDMADFFFDCHDFDDWEEVDDERFHPTYKPRPPTCKICGTKGLHWVEKEKKFRLFNNEGEPHRCPYTFKVGK